MCENIVRWNPRMFLNPIINHFVNPLSAFNDKDTIILIFDYDPARYHLKNEAKSFHEYENISIN